MKKFMGLLVVLALVAAACGGDDAADPASLDSCEEVATAGVALLQETLDTIDGLSAEDQSALLASEEEPEFLTELETRGNALEQRGAEIGCTSEQLGQLMAPNLGSLKADSAIGQLFIGLMTEAVQTGELFSNN